MALDRNTLAAAIQATFESAAAEGWTAKEVAGGLADAIHAYVQAGEVREVKTKLELDVRNNTGSGFQVGSVPLR